MYNGVFESALNQFAAFSVNELEELSNSVRESSLIRLITTALMDH